MINPRALLMTLLLFGYTTLSATEFIVATTGNDSTGDGTRSKPFASLTKGYAMASPGDTVTMLAGTYKPTPGQYGNYVNLTKVARSDAWIVLRGEPGKIVVIDMVDSYGPMSSNSDNTGADVFFLSGGTYTRIENLRFVNGKRIFFNAYRAGGSDITFSQCTIDGFFLGATYTDSRVTRMRVEDCVVTRTCRANFMYPGGAGWPSAVDLGGVDNAVVRSHIHHNWGEGIGVYDVRPVAEDNHVHDNFSVDIYVNACKDAKVQRNLVTCDGSPEHMRTLSGITASAIGIEIANETSDATKVVERATIANNIIIGKRRHGMYWWKGFQSAGLTDSLIANNTVAVEAVVSTLHMDGGGHNGTRFINNLFVRTNGTAPMTTNSGAISNLTMQYNLWRFAPGNAWAVGTGDVIAAPQFTVGSGNLAVNYALAAGSPGLDSGIAITGVTTDFVGTARPQGAAVDMGAFERMITPPVSLPVASIVVSVPTASESGATPGSVTITLSASSTTPVTISYSVTGTATAGSDYSALSGTAVISGTSLTIPIMPIDDSVSEGTESVIVTLQAGAGYTLGAATSATVTIVDNDSAGSALQSVGSMLGGPLPTGATQVLVNGVPALVSGNRWSASVALGLGVTTVNVVFVASDSSTKARQFTITR